MIAVCALLMGGAAILIFSGSLQSVLVRSAYTCGDVTRSTEKAGRLADELVAEAGGRGGPVSRSRALGALGRTCAAGALREGDRPFDTALDSLPTRP